MFSPKQVGKAIGASESSVKRWCDRGILQSIKTAGGHRRVPLSCVLDFVRESSHPLVSPGELGLPTDVGRASVSADSENFRRGLREGSYSTCRRIVTDLFLAKKSVAFICDEVVAPAMHAMGDDWCDGKIDVFAERRGCELATRLIYDLRSMVRLPQPNSPIAMGGAIENDPYGLPTRMVELTLADCGWNAISLGNGVPLESLAKAIRHHRPKLFWLSVSAIADQAIFVQQYRELFKSCGNTLVVLGGRALNEEVRKEIKYTTYCESLQRLETFVQAIYSLEGTEK